MSNKTASNIIVTGLPENSKVSKLIFTFKHILNSKGKVKKFWIKDLSDIRGTNLKSATIELYHPKDTHNALKVLDGFEYRNGDTIYPLIARLDDGPSRRSPSPYRHFDIERVLESPRRNYSRYSRDRSRSRSPLRVNTSQLDLELELLRKERMIIEEERKLLLEKKKLQLLREYDDDVDDFKYRSEGQFELDEIRPRRQSLPPLYRTQPKIVQPRPQPKIVQPRPQPKIVQPRPQPRILPPRPKNVIHPRTPQKKEKLPYKDRLPAFYSPCNMILGEMKQAIKAITPKSANDDMYKLVRTTLRKRLTQCIGQERKRLNAKEIVARYRQEYPKSTDTQLVKETLQEIDASITTSKDAKNDKEQNKYEGEGPYDSSDMTFVNKEDAIDQELDRTTDAENDLLMDEGDLNLDDEEETSIYEEFNEENIQ